MRRYQETIINKAVPVDPDLWGGKPFIECSTTVKKDITDAEMISVCNAGAYDLDTVDCRFLFNCQLLPFNIFDRLERSELVRLIQKDPTVINASLTRSNKGNSCIVPRKMYTVSNRMPELTGRRFTINRPMYYPYYDDNYQWTSADKDTETEIQLFYWLYDRDNTLSGESYGTNHKIDLNGIHDVVDPFMNDLYSRLIPGVPGEDTPGEDEEDEEQIEQACIVNRNLHGWYGIPATGYGTVEVTSGNYYQGTGTFEVSKVILQSGEVNLKSVQKIDSRPYGDLFASFDIRALPSQSMPFDHTLGMNGVLVVDNNTTTFNADVVLNHTDSLYLYTDENSHSHEVYVHYFGILLPKGACLVNHEI